MMSLYWLNISPSALMWGCRVSVILTFLCRETEAQDGACPTPKLLSDPWVTCCPSHCLVRQVGLCCLVKSSISVFFCFFLRTHSLNIKSKAVCKIFLLKWTSSYHFTSTYYSLSNLLYNVFDVPLGNLYLESCLLWIMGLFPFIGLGDLCTSCLPECLEPNLIFSLSPCIILN